MTSLKTIGTQIRRADILVGEEVLELREPSIRVTHEALDVLFDDALISAISKVAALVKERELQNNAEAEVLADSDTSVEVVEEVKRRSWISFVASHVGDIAEILKGAVIPVVSEKAGRIVSIALDTKENRKRTGKENGELRSYILEELTPGQALDVLVALKDMIDWSALGKKVQALLPKVATEMLPASQLRPETPTSPSMS